jgi:hypothetical protein
MFVSLLFEYPARPRPFALDKAEARIIIIPFLRNFDFQGRRSRRQQTTHSRENSMKTKMVLLAGMFAAVLAGISASAQQPVSPVNAAIPDMPTKTTRTGKHVNRVIDMWLKNQPVLLRADQRRRL